VKNTLLQIIPTTLLIMYHRVIHVWNILPECDNFTTYDAFKQSLTTSVLVTFAKYFYVKSTVLVSVCNSV